MKHRLAGICRPSVRRFFRRDDGTATVDAVMWMPIFVAIFALLADTALVFGDRAMVTRVVHDVNRAVSVGRIRSLDVAEATIRDGISRISSNALVDTTVSSTGLITSTVIIPVSDMTATGLVDAFTSLQLTVVGQHLAEN